MERIHLLQNHRYFNGANFILTQHSYVFIESRSFSGHETLFRFARLVWLSISILSISSFHSLRAAVFWAKFGAAVFYHRHRQGPLVMCKCNQMQMNVKERKEDLFPEITLSLRFGWLPQQPRAHAWRRTNFYTNDQGPKFMFSFLITFFVSSAFEKTKRGPHDTNENRLPKGPRVGRCRCWLLKDPVCTYI